MKENKIFKSDENYEYCWTTNDSYVNGNTCKSVEACMKDALIYYNRGDEDTFYDEDNDAMKHVITIERVHRADGDIEQAVTSITDELKNIIEDRATDLLYTPAIEFPNNLIDDFTDEDKSDIKSVIMNVIRKRFNTDNFYITDVHIMEFDLDTMKGLHSIRKNNINYLVEYQFIDDKLIEISRKQCPPKKL